MRKKHGFDILATEGKIFDTALLSSDSIKRPACTENTGGRCSEHHNSRATTRPRNWGWGAIRGGHFLHAPQPSSRTPSATTVLPSSYPDAGLRSCQPRKQEDGRMSPSKQSNGETRTTVQPGHDPGRKRMPLNTAAPWPSRSHLRHMILPSPGTLPRRWTSERKQRITYRKVANRLEAIEPGNPLIAISKIHHRTIPSRDRTICGKYCLLEAADTTSTGPDNTNDDVFTQHRSSTLRAGKDAEPLPPVPMEAIPWPSRSVLASSRRRSPCICAGTPDRTCMSSFLPRPLSLSSLTARASLLVDEGGVKASFLTQGSPRGSLREQSGPLDEAYGGVKRWIDRLSDYEG